MTTFVAMVLTVALVESTLYDSTGTRPHANKYLTTSFLLAIPHEG